MRCPFSEAILRVVIFTLPLLGAASKRWGGLVAVAGIRFKRHLTYGFSD